MNSQLAITASVGSKDDTRERVSSDECRRGVTSRTTTEVSASPDEALEVRRLRDRKDGRRLQRTALKLCALHEATARTCAGSRKARYGAGCRRSPPTGRKRAENPLSLPSKDQINEPGRACQSIDREGELTRPVRGLSQFRHNTLSAFGAPATSKVIPAQTPINPGEVESCRLARFGLSETSVLGRGGGPAPIPRRPQQYPEGRTKKTRAARMTLTTPGARVLVIDDPTTRVITFRPR